jgi:Domain of unknown function (DUF6379)
MFDNKMICTEGFENILQQDRTVGFAILARLPYYRGLGLSMVEDISLSVDGEAVPRENIRFTVRGRTWTLAEMETEYKDRWNFGEKARISALKPGGLAAGTHKIELAERLRISYLPFVPTTKDSKELVLKST